MSALEAERIRLTGLSFPELQSLLETWGEKPFRARQVWSWMHAKLIPEVAGMSDLSKALRERLALACHPLRPAVSERAVARDGTRKWLITLADGQGVETVFIPEPERGTICVSCQVGCTLACPFCQTGQQGFVRNLDAGEMVEQVLLAREEVERAGERVTNLVLMGMGEPLYNFEAVARAVRIFLDGAGLAFGTRRITLSTAGVAPLLDRVGRELGVNLAISLHAVRDEVRDRLVPLNRKYDLATLREAVRRYPLKETRRVTWEYVMLDGVNDALGEADLLADYLDGIPSKVNLLVFNPWPGAPFAPSPSERVARFRDRLAQRGLTAVVRKRRGEEIAAACGQLRGRMLGARARVVS